MYQRLKNRALAGLAEFVARHSVFVLVVAGLLAAASVFVTLVPVRLPFLGRAVGPLGFQSNRNDLISKKLPWNRRFIRWQEGFSGTTDLFIVADAGPKDAGRPARAQAVEALIDELGPALRAAPWVTGVVWGFDQLKVSPKSIRLAALDERMPSDEFRTMLADVEDSVVILSSTSPEAFVSQIVQRMQAEPENVPDEQTIKDLRSFTGVLDSFRTSLENASERETDLARLVIAQERQGGLWQYLVSDNQRLYFIRVTPTLDRENINALAPAIASVRAVLGEVSGRHPGVEVGLTGIDVVEAEETDAATRDGAVTSILSVVLITVLMVTAFHSIRMPLMHTASLLVAVAWTFGFTTLAIGHLQVISIIFVPILLGLGIAYGIYLTSRFELIRHDHPDDFEGYVAAMRDTYRIMGPGILTGCLTTALAFMMTLFTDFIGVAEMGLISGVGVIFCVISMFTVFPAMLRLVKPSHRHVVPLEGRKVRFYDDRWFTPFVRRPVVTLVVGAALVAASLVGVAGITFDFNLLKLKPEGIPGVEWERRIVEDAGESIWFGVSIVGDMDAARKRAAAFRAKPTVGVVRGVGLLMPDDEARKIELLQASQPEIDAAIGRGREPPSGRSGILPLLFILRTAFEVQSKRADIPPAIRPHVDAVGKSMGSLIAAVRGLPEEVRAARLERLDREFGRWRETTETMVMKALDPTPLGLDDLPPEILDPYRGRDGSLSLEIFPRLPDPRTSPVRDVLDPQFLPQLVADMRDVDPDVTGVNVQIYESGVLIRDSYIFAGILGMFVVFIILVLDFQSLRDGLLALVPVIAGFAVTFGIMRLIGMDINAANIIVLPLMFGIGVDSGVHIIYRSRMDPFGVPPGLTQGTGGGVILVNSTTIIGFGVLAIPYISAIGLGVRHRGIQSLGLVLTLGMAMTLLASLTIMPAWLELRRRRRMRARSAG